MPSSSHPRSPAMTNQDMIQRLGPWLREALVLVRQGRVAVVNPMAETLFGRPAAELLGQADRDLLRPSPACPPPGQSDSLLGRAQVGGLPGPMVSGTVLGLEDRGSLWVIQGPADLCQIGSLAAGLAHNLASPLSLIRNTVELLERYLARARDEAPGMETHFAAWPPAVRNGTQAVVEAVDRISGAVADVLAKMRGEADQRRVELDLNRMLNLELSLLRNDLFFKHEVELELDLSPGLPRPLGLYSDFSHALQALLTLAVDSLRLSRTKRLMVSSQAGEEEETQIQISHTGQEIPPDQLAAALAPGPAAMAGQGLAGLAAARQLLEPWGARIKAMSRPGQTVFTLTLPGPAASRGER